MFSNPHKNILSSRKSQATGTKNPWGHILNKEIDDMGGYIINYK